MATLKDIFPNATADQLKRVAAGELDIDKLISAGGATEASLKLLFPDSTNSQIDRILSGELATARLFKAGGSDTDTLKALFPKATPDQIKRLDEGTLDFTRLADAGGMGEATTAAGGTPGTGVMRGGFTVKHGGNIYQVYEYPKGSKQYVSYRFNSPKQAEAALGEDYAFVKWGGVRFNRDVLAEGEAEEIARKGNWNRFMADIVQEAAADAGVRDPGLAGRIASNPEMQTILAQAVVGDWTEEEVLAAQRNTDFWKNELYPGIENLYGKSTNPERAWREYSAQAAPILQQLGYKQNADGTFNEEIGKMLNKNVDIGTFERMAPTFIQATQNAEFASALSQWTERELGRTVGFGDWFSLLQGEAEPELMDVAERAQLQWVSDNQGSQLSQAQIEDLAERTQLSGPEAQRVFSEFNQGVLALGEQGLQKYGLSRDEVLSAAAGVTPASGRSVDEVKLLVAKTAREQALFDDEKINFYVGFNAQGQPQRQGLQSLRPEGA